MADFYVSSVAWNAVPQWAATTAYSVGQFVRKVGTPAQFYAYYVHRCTTAGTSGASEPSWGFSGTTTSGTAVFTAVTGTSTYGWSAAAGTLYTFVNAGLLARAVGDRIFVASNHSESSTNTSYAFGTAGFGGIQIISVNPAGSVPPVAADEQSGAAIITTGSSMTFESNCMVYWQGFTFTNSGATGFTFNSAGNKTTQFKNCALVLSNATSSPRIATNNPAKVSWDNVTISFGNAGQYITTASYPFDITWTNTTSAIAGATIPTTLFSTVNAPILVACRGVDLSAVTGTLAANTGSGGIRCLLDNCRVASALTRLATPSSASSGSDVIELVNGYDGTNQVNERHTAAGALTMDRNTTMSGGASDNVGAFSFKMVSSTRADRVVLPLQSFILDADNTVTGSARTATVEIISSATLNTDDVRLTLQYMDTAGSTIADVIDSASVLTTVAALPTSSVTWNNPPGTPVKQYLRVTFTPQTAGRVRGQVHLGKVSATVWFNPQLTLA